MEALKEVGIFVLTGLLGMVAYFLRLVREEQEKKITTLFDHMNTQRDNIAHLRERVARLEK